MDYFAFDFGFGLMQLIFPLVFLVILGFFIAHAVRGLGQWNRNNHSPRLTVEARVLSRRSDVNIHHHSGTAGMSGHTTSSTTYYVTFQVDSGDRLEFSLSGTEYGQLLEGDVGQLTFQGTRYLGFQRR